MAVQGERMLKSYDVAAATGSTYVIGYISANNTVARASGTGAFFAGIIENAPTNSSDKASVCVAGLTKVRAGTAAILRGTPLTSDANGHAITLAATATSHVLGYAEEAPTGYGQLFAIRVNPQHARG